MVVYKFLSAKFTVTSIFNFCLKSSASGGGRTLHVQYTFWIFYFVVTYKISQKVFAPLLTK